MDEEQRKRARDMGARMQKVRKAIGMSQVQFGELLDPQVGKQAVSAWEQGRNAARVALIATVCPFA